MGLSAGTIGGYGAQPAMELTFQALVYRPSQTRTPIGGANRVYAVLPGPIPCDVMPVTDEIRMLQSGQNEIVTHIMHFAENTDIQPKDCIKIVSHRRLGSALVGAYFYVSEELQPSEYYGFVRCRVTAGAQPTVGS